MTLSDLLDRFDLLLDTTNAIPQLRQFILQLAVQGHLTEQDPDDEPAEVLLERIQTEKQRLYDAGEIRKPKTFPNIGVEDFRFHIPENWVGVRLGAVIDLISGRHIKSSDYSDSEGEHPYLTGPSDFGTVNPVFSKWTDAPRTFADAGDILVTVKGSGVGSTNVLHKNRVAISRQLKAVRPILVEGLFLYRVLTSQFEHFQEVSDGTTVPGLKNKDLLNLPLALPPLEEQKRIVETVDRLMDECDVLEATQAQMRETQSAATVSATHTLRTAPDTDALRTAWNRVATHFDTLTATPDAVDELRQTILQLAVQGRLTEQDPDDEPAEDRVERSKMEIQRLYNDGKITRPSKRPVVQEEEKVFDVPSGWMWARLGNVLAPVNGRAYKKEELLETGTPVIRIQNLGGGGSWYYSDLELDDKKYCKEGDLLYAWSGTFGPYIWEGPRAIFHYHIWRIELTEALNKRFAYYLLKAISGDIEEGAHGIMLPHMTKGGMEKHVVPLPPVEEQQRIAESLDRLMNMCNQLTAQLEESQTTGEQWVKAALREAAVIREVPAAA